MSSDVITMAQENATGNLGKVKRATSNNIMSSFEQMLARVELAMGNLVDKVEDFEKHIEELGEELH